MLAGSCVFNPWYIDDGPVQLMPGTASSTWLCPVRTEGLEGSGSTPSCGHTHRRAPRAEQLSCGSHCILYPDRSGRAPRTAEAGQRQQLALLPRLRWTLQDGRQGRRRWIRLELRQQDESGRQTSDRDRGEAERRHEAQAELSGRAAGQARQHVN